jgi:hypothetical protein
MFHFLAFLQLRFGSTHGLMARRRARFLWAVLAKTGAAFGDAVGGAA